MKTRLVKHSAFATSVYTEVARHFKFHANGLGLHGYTTIPILESKIGTLNLVDACQRALRSKEVNYSRKFRCGLRIDFYVY